MNTTNTADTNDARCIASNLAMKPAPYGKLDDEPKVTEEEAAAQLDDGNYRPNVDGVYTVLEPVEGHLYKQHLFYTAREALAFIESEERAELAAAMQLEARGYEGGTHGWKLEDIEEWSAHTFHNAREALRFLIAEDKRVARVCAELQGYVDAGDQLNNEPAAVLVEWAELQVDSREFSDIAEALEWMARNMWYGAYGEVGNVNVYVDEGEENEASYSIGKDGISLTIEMLLCLAAQADDDEPAPVPSWWRSDWTEPRPER